MRPLDPRLVGHARATRLHIGVCVVLGCATAALVVAQAELLSRGLGEVIAGGVKRAALSPLLEGLALVLLGRALVAWVQESASVRASARIKSQLRRKLVAHAAALGPRASDGARRAEIATLATRGIDALDGYFGRYLPALALSVIVPVVVIARLAPADLVAAATILLTLPLIPIFMALVGAATEASNAARWEELARLSGHFLDVVSGLPTLKVFGRAKAQANAVRRTTDRYRTATMATLRVAFLSSLVLELVATLSVALVAVAVGLRVVAGSLDLRTGLLVLLLAPEAYLPLRVVGAQYHAAAEGLAAAERVFAVLETPLAVGGARTDVPDLRAGGSVSVAGVSVVHAGRGAAAPRSVDLVARQGELVVVTGPSGAGKTTLLAVLLGLVPPSTGAVTLRGGGREVDLSELDLAALRRNIAWVDQTPHLAAGTVAENVRLSRPDADAAAIRRALAAAGLAAIPLDRRVEEAGRGLSSGERRRVAFARAILRDAPVVLLDEPTAGLDGETERDLLRAVKGLARDRIVIMVSHRPAAIAIADRVVQLGSVTSATPLVTAAAA